MSKSESETIYGLHTVRHVLDQSPETITEAYIQKDKKPSAELAKLITLVKAANIGLQEVGRDQLDKLSENALHQGIVLKQRTGKRNNQMDLDGLLAAGEGSLLFLILDGIQDPHNLGACLRTANAAGVDAVLVSKDRSAPISGVVSKVASGGAENTPLVIVANIARTIRRLQQAGVWIVGTAGGDEHESLYDVDLTVSVAIVMGSEGKGLRHNTREHCDYLVRLPMHGVVESLNVSVAAGVCLYEALRQRNASKPST